MVTEEAVGARHQKGNLTWPWPRPLVCAEAQSGTGEAVSRPWDTLYFLIAALADCVWAIAGVLPSAHVRFGAYDELPVSYNAAAVRLDKRYAENWSFALDLQILWKTGSTLVRVSGAC